MQERLVMLVVDDVEVNRVSLRTLFCEEYEILEAKDGQEAMEILCRTKVDIVILDVFMPVLDGVGVLEQMKANHTLRDIPVIVKTAMDEAMEVTMLEKGADDFIFSPCEPAVIKNRVHNIVQKYIFQQLMLQRQIEEEQHFSRVREKFISRISNGVQQELAAIQRLCRTGIGENGEVQSEQERLEKIGAYASRLMLTAEELASQVEEEHEEQMLHMLPFRLSDLLAELTEECMEKSRRKGIDFTVEKCDIAYNHLVGDRKRLKQVWKHMIENAFVNASERSSVRTGCLQRESGKGQVELEITVCGNLDPKGEFPIANSIAELLRGTMQVEETRGEGAVSVITIPFKIAKPAQIQQKKITSMRALVVDDNDLTRQYGKILLTRLGVRCDTAANGAATLNLLRKAYLSGEVYDICLLNWRMLGAQETIREMKRIFPAGSMPIISSSNGKEDAEKKMREAGVDYVVEHPIYQSDLYRLLTAICSE